MKYLIRTLAVALAVMMAILLMNMFAPLIDYCVVERNISRRVKRSN